MESNAVYILRRTVEQVDAQGHANNVLYVQWMQDAAVAHSSAVGLTPEKYREMGQAFVVRRHVIEYLRPASRGTVVEVHTWVVDFRGAGSRRCYQFLDAETREVLARAATDWAYIDTARGRPTRIPPEVARLFPVHRGPFDSISTD
jgi:acyl-CoA thioester hydrolase